MTGTGSARDRPLDGWRVLVPSSAERAGGLSDALVAAGASPVAVDLISIEPPADLSELDAALNSLANGGFGWVAFTSVNAVRAVLGRAAALGLDSAVPAGTRVAAVGPATAEALRAEGCSVALMPAERGSGVALAASFPPATAGEVVLLPRSDLAAADLPEALMEKGFRVVPVTAYRTLTHSVPAPVAHELAVGAFDAILLTSPSAVQALAGIEVARSTVFGAIGSPTTAALEAAGRRPHFTANSPTPAGLVDGLIAVAATRRLIEK